MPFHHALASYVCVFVAVLLEGPMIEVRDQRT